MEQYIPHSLICDLFSRNFETYLQREKYLLKVKVLCIQYGTQTSLIPRNKIFIVEDKLKNYKPTCKYEYFSGNIIIYISLTLYEILTLYSKNHITSYKHKRV